MLGPRSKEALSWLVISEILRQSALDLDIAVLRPGGGQYDSLCLATHEGNPIVQINRNGLSASAGGNLVPDIFKTAAKSPSLAANRIIKSLSMPIGALLSAQKRIKIKCAVEIANFLNFYLKVDGHCEWGWSDSEYGSGPNPAIHRFTIPDSWRKQQGLFKNTSWETAVFLLFVENQPRAAVNISIGEIVDTKGKSVSNLVPAYSEEGLVKSHVAVRMIFKDRDGKIMLDEEVHPSMTRITRRIYSEEYLIMPEESEVFEYSCNEQEALRIWNIVEGGAQPRDYLE